MTRQSIHERGDPLKTKFLFVKRSDLHVAVQRAGPHLQPFAAGLRLAAIISSLTRLRFSRRVFLFGDKNSHHFSNHFRTNGKEKSYATTNHSINTN